jgi:pimeloyl-ACP methyl ester carboxylesterase
MTVTTSLARAALLLALNAPTPPEQPLDGPGGRSYAHEAVTASRLGSGAEEVYLFEPADPAPESAPVVVFGHGWGGMSPNYYGAWIEHIVRRGSIVIFPRYQADLGTPVRDFTENALRATRDALEELRAPGHVAPDERGLAFVGHSMGGLIVANLAARAAKGELPPPLAVMAVEPGKTWPESTPIAFPLEDLSELPSNLLLLALVGDDDDFVRDVDARKIYGGATRVPLSNKDYVRMFSDDYGTPDLVADHRAPTAPSALVDGAGAETTADRGTDSLDFYGTWKLFDALVDAAYRGVHREYALGDTPAQRFMGQWSDGTPVRELLVREP